MTFFDYFDRVWVISLVERADRRRRVGRELVRVGMPLTPGKVEFFDGIRARSADGFPSAGYHGCFLSHRAVLGRGVAWGCRRMLTLEDDVVFRPDFKAREAAAVEAMERAPGWGVVQFGHLTARPVGGPGLVAPPRDVTGAHFFATSGSALPRLKAWFDAALDRPAGHPDGGRMSPDGTLNHFRWANPDVPAFLYTPVLGRQSNSPSDLAGRTWFDNIPIAGVLLRSTRGLLRQEKWD
jgi:glycosyl transferase family 25